MKAIAVTTHAIGDPMSRGDHFIINGFKDTGGGLVALETSAGWRFLEPLDGTDGIWYTWRDGPAEPASYRTCGRLNGQVLTLNPHGNRPYAFGWSDVEV